jgi:hypothetical protein
VSVLDSSTDRLYAGALLGKALSKELGQVGGQQDQIKEGERKATLEAGIASGKISAKNLSGEDASLLGNVLSGDKLKLPGAAIPSIGKPLEFVGGFLGNLAKGAGEFGENLKGIGPALLKLGEAGVSSVNRAQGNPFREAFETGRGENEESKVIGQQLQQTAHAFSSPQQIYEHPFEPLLDVAGVASGGAGLLTKGAGALARAGQFAEGGRLSALGSVGKKLVDIGSPEGRAGVSVSPGFKLGDESGLGKVFERKYATQRPFMKYVVQKPLDKTISTLQSVPILGDKLTDLQAGYYGRKLIGKVHGQESAGASESFLKSPVQDLIKTLEPEYKRNPNAASYQFEAAIRASQGIDTLGKLDEYANKLRSGEDIEGPIITPDMQKMADYRANKLYQDERFRQLIENPTNWMKEVAYQLRRVNLKNAYDLDIAPQVSEDAAFSRLRELTGKNTEELKGELPPELQSHNDFAKSLYNLQEAIQGHGVANILPTVDRLAREIPYGTMPQRVSVVERAIRSYTDDLKDEGSTLDRHSQPNYIAGNNLFEKIANALHTELGASQEQAAAFARGIALGSPEGPILPTYTPSVSGEKLNFGIRPDKLRSKVGQALGVAKLKAIEDYPKQPSYYDFKRPFNPRNVSAQTLGLGPKMNYLKEADYGPFLTGTDRIDPEAIIRNAYRINKDLVIKKLNPEMLRKLGMVNPRTGDQSWKSAGEILEVLGTKAALYDFVPVDTYRNFFSTQHGLEIDIADAMKAEGEDLNTQIGHLAEEAAQKFVSEEMAKAGAGQTLGLALPKTFTKTIAAHARISEQATGIGRFLAEPVAVWKTAVLSFSPAWLARTTIGHGILALIDGTMNPKYWIQANRYFAEDRPFLPEQMKAIDWGKKYGDTVLNPEPLPYGVNQGGMRQELEDIQGGSKGLGNLAIPHKISELVHVQNNFQRRAISLRKLEVEVKQRLAELEMDFNHPGGFWNAKNIDAALDPAWREEVLKYPDLLEHVFDQVSKVSYTFSQMNPWERQVVRYGRPFWGWVKFVKKFVWSIPMNYPGRAAAIAALGRIGVEETNKLGPMPGYLSGALWFNYHDLSKAHYVNLYGLNPLGEGGENPFVSGGFLKEAISPSQTTPITQAVLAGLGINPLTLEQEGIDPRSGIETGRYGELIDTKTGKTVSLNEVNSVQRFLGTFLRSFPELRTSELALTGGNPVYPESIPFVDEKPIGVNPQTRRDNTLVSVLGQEIGVQPREYNLAKYAAKQLKAVTEARKKNLKTIAKAEAKLRMPNP